MSAVTCTAVDNPGVTVRGKIVDKDGGYTTYMAAVLIQNVSPAVTILTPPSGEIYAKGTSVPFTARVIDPGALDHASGPVDVRERRGQFLGLWLQRWPA